MACGFEHCVANMYILPLGKILANTPEIGTAASEGVNAAGLLRNLIPVTIGNIFGGAIMVGLVYYVVYLRGHKS